MLVKYIGKKQGLHMTRRELSKEYTFNGGDPIEVDDKDALYLCKEFHGSFRQVDESRVDNGQPIDEFIEQRFPGKGIDDLEKDEIEAACLKETGTYLKKNKSVLNMVKDYMKAVR